MCKAVKQKNLAQFVLCCWQHLPNLCCFPYLMLKVADMLINLFVSICTPLYYINNSSWRFFFPFTLFPHHSLHTTHHLPHPTHHSLPTTYYLLFVTYLLPLPFTISLLLFTLYDFLTVYLSLLWLTPLFFTYSLPITYITHLLTTYFSFTAGLNKNLPVGINNPESFGPPFMTMKPSHHQRYHNYPGNYMKLFLSPALGNTIMRNFHYTFFGTCHHTCLSLRFSLPLLEI